jgi:iron(III) transport system substrate-binding protein
MHKPCVPTLLAAFCIVLAGCEKSPESATPQDRKEPVVVYAAFEDDARLRDLFANYTEESGVFVVIRRGTEQDILNDLVENKVLPPADVLMTHSVTGVWHAAEEGALRPLLSENLKEKTPAWSRDPDNLWAGLGFRTAVLAYDAGVVSIDESLAYADLAEPRFEGQLCLSSSANPMNQAVVAMLIREQGARPAELIVRGWMKNLATPVLESDSQVLEAIATGKCSIGIVSNDATTGFDLSVHTPAPAFADIDGIGIGRHAKNPAGAAALVEWLLATLPATHFDGHEKVTQQNVGLVAWYQQDVTKLAERARYR